MTAWNEASRTRKFKIGTLLGIISGYGYPSEDIAHRTDELVCRAMIENLRVTKNVMFNVLETAYEMHRELLLKDFDRLRNDIDVFSDEIKARVFRWDNEKSQKWFEKLVDYDYRLLTGLGKFVGGVRALEKEFLSTTGKTPEVRKLDEYVKGLTKLLDRMVTMFRERDAVCDIGNRTLEESFDDMREDIGNSA
jgi:hypothetical protein